MAFALFQYSLLQTASETCQKKRHCKFTASARAFGGDPCPGVKKFVEVAFKCRPCEYIYIMNPLPIPSALKYSEAWRTRTRGVNGAS